MMESNGLSVSRSSVLKFKKSCWCHNWTYNQRKNTISRRYTTVIRFSRTCVAYYRWATARYFRAHYTEAAICVKDVTFKDIPTNKELHSLHIHNSETSVKRLIDTASNFTSLFGVNKCLHALYCLSSIHTRWPDAAGDLFDVTAIGSVALEEIIANRLVERSVIFHDPIKRKTLM